MTIKNKQIFNQLPYCDMSELNNEIKKFRKIGISTITFFTGETDNIQGLLYEYRNNDGLCYIHPSELDRHVANNINLCYQTLEYDKHVIQYVVDGDILFFKNMNNTEPYLRIRKGVYSVTRDEYPELFNDCHEKITELCIVVSYNSQDSSFLFSYAISTNDNRVVVKGNHRIGISVSSYQNDFDTIHPFAILKCADKQYKQYKNVAEDSCQ